MSVPRDAPQIEAMKRGSAQNSQTYGLIQHTTECFVKVPQSPPAHSLWCRTVSVMQCNAKDTLDILL